VTVSTYGPTRRAQRCGLLDLIRIAQSTAVRRQPREQQRPQRVAASAKDYADLLERVYTGEGRLATVLNVPGDDPEATRTEALAIGRWARNFAQSLHDGDQ
jgi:hypothetical protein